MSKKGGIGALESLLGGIDNENEIEEIRSIAYSMYEEFHSDQKKRIIRNITIVSTVTMSAAFGVFITNKTFKSNRRHKITYRGGVTYFSSYMLTYVVLSVDKI